MKRQECHATPVKTYDDKGEDVFLVGIGVGDTKIVLHQYDAAKLAYDLHAVNEHIRGLLKPKARFGKLRVRLSDWLRPY